MAFFIYSVYFKKDRDESIALKNGLILFHFKVYLTY